jgi:hypothetical protein
MSMTSFIDNRYNEEFESVYNSLDKMVQEDRDRAEPYIRGILKNMYIRQGNDWTGRGAIGDAGLSASIAAYECILAELNHRKKVTKETEHHER